jgi:hypothetical protein
MIEDATTWRLGPPPFPQVEVPGAGAVSLATLAELRDARASARRREDDLARRAAELDGLAEDRLAQAGAFLVTHQEWWEAPPGVSPLLARAERLVARISWLDERSAGLEAGGGPLGNAVHPVSTLRGWWGVILRGQRVRSVVRLRRTLVRIAGVAAHSGLPEVGPLLDHAAELRARAGDLRPELAAATSASGALGREIAAREGAERALGVDALLLAAQARTSGLPVVPCPFELEPGEVAHLVVEAVLARMPSRPQQARAEAGRGVPVALTGIHQWIGRLRGGRAPRASVAQGEAGTLAVSNRRLLFVGSAESVAIPLSGVVEVDVFADGIAVSRLGRETPDLFLVTAPGQVVLTLNWALSAEVG